MEQIVFPVPGICQFLTEETKHRLFTTTEQDDKSVWIIQGGARASSIDFTAQPSQE